MQELDIPEFDLTRALEQAKALDELVKEQVKFLGSDEQRLALLKESNSVILALSTKIQQQQQQLKKELTLLSTRKNANKQYLDKE